tara:strand:+ start:16997 stop:18298 length:1302 start_codon:yes stop_codon:yes gene_type:complete
MTEPEKQLLYKATKVLEQNWRSEYTAPSSTFYTHQWNWDSAFIAIGNSHINQEKAQKELLAMFEGQWKNGMLPHIIFRAESDYFPGPEYWKTEISENSPKIKTSGITQPPVHAIAALEIYNNAKNKEEAKDFLKKIYPKILTFHNYLLTKRDPEKSGLITIFHPWESGLDNSIRWDKLLKKIKPKNLPKYDRTDIKKIHSSERPSAELYDKFIYLIELIKENKYNEEEIYKKTPFKVKDSIFSSILYVANNKLLEIAKIIEEDTREIELWIKRTKENYSNYFSLNNKSTYLIYDYDLITKRKIIKRTAAVLFGLYTHLLDEKNAKKAIAFMKRSHYSKENKEHKMVTSVSIKDKEYDPLNYWRGPIWINLNWLIYKGLKSYGFNDEADIIKKSILDLISEHGFYEYYHPSSGKGLGTNNFSWTAALAIDFLNK